MTLSAGTKLGPYEILSQVGAGGMGEVYKARDTRLERTVAIKVLPAALSASEEIRQRFEREAKTVSQFSHPHICNLYDVGRQDDTDYLVMEFLEGETLALRLAKGPLPLEQTLRFGMQIADALDRAHRQGIVHRDLKPGNVMLTKGGVKLLDFGLAKEMQGAAAGGDTALPTRVSENLTEKGTVLGTFQYMSPEQLEGRDADARSDIFALGAVLYEMATGRKAFAGMTQASLISAILRDEPEPISQIAPMTPPALDRVVKTCLAKDPEERWQSAGDVGKELKWIAEGSSAGVAAPQPVAARRRNRERIAWGLAAVAIAAAAWFGLSRSKTAEPPRGLRAAILLPEKLSLHNAVLSPDGSRFVFGGRAASGKDQLWLRALDAPASAPIAGTENGLLPFWSPDGRSIGFFADGKLKRTDLNGGSPLALADADGVGGAWAPNGDIVFAGPAGPIQRLPISGGAPTAVTKLDAARGETAHRYPFFLPDGKHFLFLALNVAGADQDPANRLWVGSLDGGPPKPLVVTKYNAQYSQGHLLFVRGGNYGGVLVAQPFDPARLETSGTPITLADQVAPYGDFAGFADYSVSSNGTLLMDTSPQERRLEWFDRKGTKTGDVGDPSQMFTFALAPDASRVAESIFDPGSQTMQIWISDVARGVRTRLTAPPGDHLGAVWSPDGTRIVCQTDLKHQADIVVRAADGSGGEEMVTDEVGQRFPADWSKDDWILHLDREAAGSRREQLAAISLSPPRKTVIVVPHSVKDFGFTARFSPDGRWVTYDQDESGRSEVYVISFPEARGRVQVSTNGGLAPRWTRDGKEIVYEDFDDRILAVDVDTSHGVRTGTPRFLFQMTEEGGLAWDVTSDGERFLVGVPVVKSTSRMLDLVVNWPAALKK
ncbi:MAG TPA: protein kinase [Thermoanaerobaculia bacterium]|nr:protein kinase [Thermoanaerobaculia bacterium]